LLLSRHVGNGRQNFRDSVLGLSDEPVLSVLWQRYIYPNMHVCHATACSLHGALFVDNPRGMSTRYLGIRGNVDLQDPQPRCFGG
jgi:hypothetical protein